MLKAAGFGKVSATWHTDPPSQCEHVLRWDRSVMCSPQGSLRTVFLCGIERFHRTQGLFGNGFEQ